ncbi:MAG: alpha/beta hydrolase [Nanoarchaeota archaeon]
MKRVILVHRWDGSPKADWYPWIKKELEKNDITVEILKMPNPGEPSIEAWVPFLEKNVKNVDADTYLIGHSVGCQTILRYLATLPADQKAGGVLCVAGWFSLQRLTTPEERDIAGPWLTEPFDFDSFKKRKIPLVALFSDDDPFVPLENKDLFEKKLGATTVVENHQGHFNDKKTPSVLEHVLRLLNL